MRMTAKCQTSDREPMRRVWIILSLLASLSYLVVRALFTLNLESRYGTVVSLLLFGAEFHGVTLMSLYFWQIWNTQPSLEVPVLADKTVDILVPTYNEDAHLLRGTIQSLIAMDYPHRVFLLDDGNRPAMKQLADDMGVEYIARTDNLHAKAGNINHALDQLDGEFVAIFDADHIVRKNFITRTIGYFADDSVAFVQTPHSFYNFDNYGSQYCPQQRDYWEEGELFHNCIQAGKSNANAVIFCGSAAIFRRSALNDIGLIATETITEDMHTGLRLHANGWNSVFVNERLIAAQAATDVTSYQTQRLRWGEGNLGIMKYDNPLYMRGLTLTQRLHYLGSMLGWTTGAGKLLLYLSPILMLLTGVSPAVGFTPALTAVLVSHLVIGWIALKISGNGHFRIVRNEISSMAVFWVQIRAMKRALLNRNRIFEVTSKRGSQSGSLLRVILPQLLIFIVGSAAVAWAWCTYWLGIYSNPLGLSVGTGLILLQNVLAWIVIRRGLKPSDPRFSYRHQTGRVHASVSWVDDNGTSCQAQSVCLEVNECGTSLHGFVPHSTGRILQIELRGSGHCVSVQGKVTACNPVIEKRESSITTGNAFRTGIKFENVDGPTYDGLWSLTIDNIVSATYQEIEGKRSGESAEVTKLLKLPCSLRPRDYDEEGWTNLGILTAVDVKGFSMLTEPLDHFQGKSLAFKIETPLGSVSGEAELCGNPDEQRNASISRFDVKRFDGQGRGLVKKIGEIESRRSLRHLVEYSAESPKLPFSRTTVLVGAPSISLSISLVLLLLFYHPHHVTLAKIAHAKQPASTDLVKLDEMTSAALDGTFTDLALMVKLKNILHHVGRDEQALQVLERLTELNPKNSGLMLAKANAYRDQGLEERAFDATLALCLRFPDEQRPDAILSAVRSGIALERDKEALKLMAGLSQVELNSKGVAAECAGYYLKLGHPDKALSVLGILDGTQSIETGMLAAKAHAAKRDWIAALEMCRSLGQAFPDSGELLAFWGDCRFWTGDYVGAIEQYTRAISVSTLGKASLRRWADAYLQVGNAGRTLELAEQAWLGGETPSTWYPLILEGLVAENKLSPDGARSTDSTFGHDVVERAMRVLNPEPRLLRAVSAYLDYTVTTQTAIDYLTEHDSQVRNYADLRLQLATLNYRLEAYSESFAIAENVSAMKSAGQSLKTAARLLAARSLAQIDRLDVALPRFRELIADNPDDVSIRIEMAGLAMAHGLPEEALELCRRTDSKHKSSENIDMEIAALAALKRWPELIAYCDEQLKHSPDNLGIKTWRAKSLIWKGDHQQGAAILEELLPRLPLDDEAHLLFARALCWSRKYERSLPLLIDLNADRSADPDVQREVLFAASGSKSKTDQQLRRIDDLIDQLVTANAVDTETLIAACDLLIQQQNFKRVVQWLPSHSPQWEHSLRLRLRLARALSSDGKFDLAAQHYDEILANPRLDEAFEKSINSPNTTERRGESRQDVMLAGARNAAAAGDLTKSVKYYRALIEEFSNPVDVRCEYAAALLADQRPAEALAVFPNNSQLSFINKMLYVDVCVATNDFVLAGRVCKELLDQQPNNRDVLLQLARVMVWDKQFIESVPIWEQLLEESQSDAAFRSEFARVLTWAGRSNQALQHYQWVLERGNRLSQQDELPLLHAVANTGNSTASVLAEIDRIEAQQQSSRVIDNETVEFLAYIRADLKQYNAAAELLQRLLTKDPSRRDLRLLWADMLHQAHRYRESESVLAALLEI